MIFSLEFARKTAFAYNVICKPLWVVMWRACCHRRQWEVFGLYDIFIAAKFANKAEPKTLNRATGLVLVILGIVIMGFQVITK